MIIGIDIDNVLADYNGALEKVYAKFTKKHHIKLKDKNAYFRQMYDWDEKEEQKFYYDNIEKMIKNLQPQKHCQKIITKLHNDGHKIFIITGRDNKDYVSPKEITKAWLENNNIYYDKLIFTNAYILEDKAQSCLKNKIDIMIDDSKNVFNECSKLGIRVLLFDTKYNRDILTNDRVYDWKQIYKFIKMSK